MSWVLIVATIGRCAPVGQLLASLGAQQGVGPLRVIIVDQNRDGRLDDLVAAWSQRLIIEHLRIPPRGVSQARNAGLACVRDECFVAFPDDDSFFESSTLAKAELAFADTPGAGIVLGILHLPEAERCPGPEHAPEHLQRPSRIGLLHAAGMPMQFFRREAALAAGAFDETLGPGAGTPWLCGEDSDFLLKAVAAGYAVVRSPAVRVFHPAVDVSFPGYQAKAYGYGRGRIRLLRLHGYPWWFVLATLIHPLVGSVSIYAEHRGFRWHLFRGRLREVFWPHRRSDGC